VDAGAGKKPVAHTNPRRLAGGDFADHDFEAQELELKTNTDITRQIHALTEELHRRVIGGSASPTPDPSPAT
jgi:hypothetical protein